MLCRKVNRCLRDSPFVGENLQSVLENQMVDEEAEGMSTVGFRTVDVVDCAVSSGWIEPGCCRSGSNGCWL